MKIRMLTSAFAVTLLLTGAARADCLTDVQTIKKGMESSGPYSVDMEMDSSGSKTKMVGKVIMPHSMHIKGDSVEMVMTPNGVWMARGGALQKMPDGMKEQIQGMIKQGMNLGLSAIREPECAGGVEFEGATFNLFKYKSDAEFMGIKSTANVAMYVDGDSRPVWMVIDGEAMGVKSLTKQHITYDDSITISDPQ